MSNLPPGVSVWDIPGNRPEDEADEKFWEAVCERADIENDDKAREIMDRLADSDAGIKVAEAIRDLAYQWGRNDEKADAEVERVMSEQAQYEELFGEDAVRVRAAVRKLTGR